MTVLETFRMMAAEFQRVPDETVEQWITLAGPLVSKKRFGPLYVQAVALLAAHKMKLAGFGGDGMEGIPVNGGGVSSYTEGGTSVSFNTTQQTNLVSDAEYGLSNYGTQFLSLRRSCIMPILLAGLEGYYGEGERPLDQ